MGVAPALMAIAAVVLIGYPALGEVLVGMNDHTDPTSTSHHNHRPRRPSMPVLPIQLQIMTAFLLLRDRVTAAISHVRDDERGELTGSVIFLAALAVAAAAVAAVIIVKLNSNAGKIPD